MIFLSLFITDNWACFKQSCYKLLENNYTDIEDCRKECMVKGGDLASIHDKEENNFIRTLQKDNLVWIGGRIDEKLRDVLQEREGATF